MPRRWRPFGARAAAAVFAVVLVGAMVLLWLSFSDASREAVTAPQRLTVVAMMLGALAGLHALARCRVDATESGLVVVNGYRRRELVWAQVVAVRMPPGAPWPTLDLTDGTTLSAMGIQGSDGERARRAVADLRRLIAAH